MSQFKKQLKGEYLEKALLNGHHSGNHRTVHPSFHSWWDSVKDFSPSRIQRLFASSQFSGLAPELLSNSQFLYQHFIEPNKPLLKPIFSRYNNLGCGNPIHLTEITNNFRSELSEVIADSLVVEVLVQQYILNSKRCNTTPSQNYKML